MSRRTKLFNDDESVDEDDALSTSSISSGTIKYQDTFGKITELKPNDRLKNFQEIFTNLLVTQSRITMYPIVSMIITYDSTRAVTVTKKSH